MIFEYFSTDTAQILRKFLRYFEITVARIVAGKSLMAGGASLPDLAEPSPDDYVLMKEETFNLDPAKELGCVN